MTLKPLWVVGGEDWPIQRPKRALNLPSKAVVVAVCREAVQLLLLVPQKIQEAEGLLSHLCLGFSRRLWDFAIGVVGSGGECAFFVFIAAGDESVLGGSARSVHADSCKVGR